VESCELPVNGAASGDQTTQQTRDLTLGERFENVKFLIRDRGSNFTASFDARF